MPFFLFSLLLKKFQLSPESVYSLQNLSLKKLYSVTTVSFPPVCLVDPRRPCEVQCDLYSPTAASLLVKDMQKGKVVSELILTEHHAMKAYGRNGGIAPRILDTGTRWM
jgi:hypothetical protein